MVIVVDVMIGICGIEELVLTIALLVAPFVVLFTFEIRSFTSSVTLELATYTNLKEHHIFIKGCQYIILTNYI